MIITITTIIIIIATTTIIITSNNNNDNNNKRFWYLPNQWIAIFARFDWLPYLGISLAIHCFANGKKNGASFRESFRRIN